MMRRVLLVLAGLTFLATVVMIFLAGVGAFDAAPRAESFEPHRLVGRILFGLAVLALVAAAVARVPGRLIGLTALVVGLVVVQSLIGVIAGGFDEQSPTAANLVFGLHAVNGLITMGVARTVVVRARQLVTAQADASAAVDAAPLPGPLPAGS